MDIFTTPAVNLLGVGLFNINIYRTDFTIETVTVIVPEFSLENFLTELEGFKGEHDAYSDMDMLVASYPTVYRYIFEHNDITLHKSELVEIAWGISFEVGSPFPRYFQGMEIK